MPFTAGPRRTIVALLAVLAAGVVNAVIVTHQVITQRFWA
jgi:hypothetical protein